MKAILFITLIAIGELSLVFGVFGCGGVPFTLISSDPTREASPSDSPLWAPEASEAETETAATPDAKLDAPIKLPRPDASRDAGPLEAEASPSPEADPPEASTCTPLPTSTFACGTDRVLVSAPDQFCVALNNVTTAPGVATSTPPECRCAETYNCACILAAIPNPCGSQTVARCLDKGAPLMRPGSTVVCQ